MNNDPIISFRGPYFFLSNFSPALVKVNGITFPTVEHAFQASKTNINSERAQIWHADGPAEAKRRGRRVTLRPDWQAVKRFIMAELLEQKFNHPALANLLLATNPRMLVECNEWNDTYWGAQMVKPGDPRRVSGDGWRWSNESRMLIGENNLGWLLMERRDKLANVGVILQPPATDPWL